MGGAPVIFASDAADIIGAVLAAVIGVVGSGLIVALKDTIKSQRETRDSVKALDITVHDVRTTLGRLEAADGDLDRKVDSLDHAVAANTSTITAIDGRVSTLERQRT